jgi:flagellar basal body P-ring formation protein FlgA
MKTFIFSFIFGFASLALAKSGEIVISSATEISPRQTITVYDIVETKSVSYETLEQLKSIKIADADSMQINQADLVKKLRSVDSYFKFPQVVKLIRSRQAVSRMELERKIKNQLMTRCHDCEFKISINSVPPNIESEWDIDLNVDLNKRNVLIPVTSGHSQKKTGWITAEIKKYQNVMVLNQDVKSGDSITEGAYSFELRDVSNMRNIIHKNSIIKGMQAQKFLATGEVVKTTDLKKELVLKKGQIVKALYNQSQMQISISALAEESGSIGDTIKFKNLDSQKIFSARIVEKGVVEIE